jgi:alkanesulfonate monooxygenase SsuD/methylene tetrahydromethanopterin reductase-like flavin-dependent oxidoreductase (luciferase family)
VPVEESADRFREAVEIVLEALSRERFSYHGTHFHFDDIEVLPKPLQKPLPAWMAATSEGAIDWAAGRGFSILMDPHASFRELAAKRQHYATRMAEAGFSDKGRDIPMARLMALAGSASEAEAIARRGAQWIVDSYSGPQHAHRKAMPPRTYDGKEPAQHYVDSVVLHGTPEMLVDKVAELEETIGLNYLMCAPLSRDSFRLLADKVVPRLI